MNTVNALFRELDVKVARGAVWSQVLGVATRRGRARGVVVARLVDKPEVVASTDPRFALRSVFPDEEVVAWCLKEGSPRFLSDRDDGGKGGSGTVALLPLKERDEVVAVLRLECDDGLWGGGFEEMTAVGHAISSYLTARSWALQAELTSELTLRLSAVDDLTAGAAACLSVLAPAFAASGGTLHEARCRHLVPLADYGEHAIARRPALTNGIPYGEGLAWDALTSREARFTRDYQNHPGRLDDVPADPVVLALPLEFRGATRNVLVLYFTPDNVPVAADLTVLSGACASLAGMLDRLRSMQAVDRLSELQDRLLDLRDDELHQRALVMAVECVPGAERGSMLVRSAPEEDFRFGAAVGYDLGATMGLDVTEEGAAGWYSPVEQAWGKATPRITRASATNFMRVAWLAGVKPEVDRAGKLPELKANLCIPVRVGGHVMAVVNLDSITTEDAFAKDSVRTAQQFALVLSAVLRVTSDHESVVAMALTDPVTGLLNRRGAELELERALARAARYGEPMSVLLLDMGGFKRVNDTLGHDAGDEALRMVADTLRRYTRGGDELARWGGDEFLAVLTRQDAEDAALVSRRLQWAVSRLRIQGHKLEIHGGVASYPADEVTAEALVKAADTRMYEVKRRASGREFSERASTSFG